MKKAKSVSCVDIIPAFLDVNRQNYSGCGDVTYITADVSELTMPAGRSYNFVNYCLTTFVIEK